MIMACRGDYQSPVGYAIFQNITEVFITATRNILKFGDETLLKISRPVTEFDGRLTALIDDLTETMRARDGCGLAAVQVGVLRRVCVVDTGHGVVELVNPEIIERHGVQEESEGCLSSPGEYGITRRPRAVRVRAQDRHGKIFTTYGEDLTARAFCHEIDHLDGILFTTHVIRPDKTF